MNAAYTANDLNQYTGTTNPTEYLCYDADGNMTRDGKSGSTCPGNDWRFKYLWDAENRLIAVEPRDPSANPVRVAFKNESGVRASLVISEPGTVSASLVRSSPQCPPRLVEAVSVQRR